MLPVVLQPCDDNHVIEATRISDDRYRYTDIGALAHPPAIISIWAKTTMDGSAVPTLPSADHAAEIARLQRERSCPAWSAIFAIFAGGESFLLRNIASGHPADGADKPFGWRGGNGNFQFLETDLEKLRAVGYAGGNCRDTL